MKDMLAIVVLIGICGCRANAQSSKWTVTLKAIDEQNQPVTNATVSVAWHVPPPPDRSIALTNVTGLTDENGVFSTTQTSGSIEVLCSVNKQGCYPAAEQHWFSKYRDNDSAKWNPSLSLLLKKIGKPTPMYAKWLNTRVPALDKPVGFDLMAGDWNAPYGRGNSSDILFTGHFDRRPDGESDFTLTVTFPNVGDGIREFTLAPLEKTSALTSPHEAPLEGYQSQWVQTDIRKPGKPVETNRDPSRNYLFRVRTLLDERGNVKSALYGKIYGDFMEFTYYLNPTPNDRGLEFDPGTNLIRGQRVDAP